MRAVDGDTLLVRLASGERERVRVIGVDTPRTSPPARPVQCWSRRAAAFTQRTLAGRVVRLVPGRERRRPLRAPARLRPTCGWSRSRGRAPARRIRAHARDRPERRSRCALRDARDRGAAGRTGPVGRVSGGGRVGRGEVAVRGRQIGFRRWRCWGIDVWLPRARAWRSGSPPRCSRGASGARPGAARCRPRGVPRARGASACARRGSGSSRPGTGALHERQPAAHGGGGGGRRARLGLGRGALPALPHPRHPASPGCPRSSRE